MLRDQKYVLKTKQTRYDRKSEEKLKKAEQLCKNPLAADRDARLEDILMQVRYTFTAELASCTQQDEFLVMQFKCTKIKHVMTAPDKSDQNLKQTRKLIKEYGLKSKIGDFKTDLAFCYLYVPFRRDKPASLL